MQGLWCKKTINTLTQWTKNIGFSFSAEKTKTIIFSRRRLPELTLNLYLDDKQIKIEDTVKFLGLTFDKRLTWLPHFKNLKTSCRKSLNLLKVLNGKNNGADRKPLINIYKSKISSKIDYASIVYSSARPQHLSLLDPIHNLTLRICTGMYRTCPTESLYCETGEFSLENRREFLCLKYFYKIIANPQHLNRGMLEFPPKFLYTTSLNLPKPLTIRIRIIMGYISLNLTNAWQKENLNTPPCNR